MIPYKPDLDEVDDKHRLSQIIRPRGWENLAGPFRWYDPVEPTPELLETDEYGHAVKVKPRGRFGQIAMHINATGGFPAPVYLFSGPPGIGKSATERLFARTHLTSEDELKPVSYPLGEETEVTLLHHETMEPFYLNPSGSEDLCGEKQVDFAFQNPGNESNRRIRFYNASDVYKDDARNIASWLKEDLFLEKKRVLILSEIDELTSSQAKLLKNELEQQNVNQGVLVMSDTNYLAKVKDVFDRPGMQRFEHVAIPKWSRSDMIEHAQIYTDCFAIQFDQEQFADVGTDPATQIAEASKGSFRTLITFLQRLLDEDEAISPEGLRETLKVEEEVDPDDDSINQGQWVWNFRRNVLDGNQSVEQFCHQLSDNENLFGFFVVLCGHVVDGSLNASLPAISHPMRMIFEILHSDYDKNMQLISISGPLKEVADQLNG